jgi:hypothetical protein
VRARVHLDRDIRFATVEVMLSESNLEMLLRKLRRSKERNGGSARIVVEGDVTKPWVGNLVIRAMSDDEHYVDSAGSVKAMSVNIIQSEDFNEEDNPCGC